jgi:hypothetical protein
MTLNDINYREVMENKKVLEDFDNAYHRFGVGGLLGHYFSNEFNQDNPKFNLDFPQGKFSYSPNDKLNLYVKPQTSGGGRIIPRLRGLTVGGSYKF